MNDPRGSCWRRWDLQVHTPYSELNNGFGTDFNVYVKELLTKAKDNNIACIGVTDYFLIEGYKALKEIIDNDINLKTLLTPSCVAHAKQILYVPNIEFRSSTIVRDRVGGKTHDSRVNFHILFADSVSPETIEEDFLRELKFSADGAPATPDEQWSLTRRNLEAFGKKLKSQHENFQERSDFFVGQMNAVVNHNDAINILEGKPSKFHGRYLLGVACDEDLSAVNWNDQGHQARKLFYQSSHFLFSSNPNTRKFALGQLHPSIDKYIDEFKTKKPCFHGSDAHSIDELFAPKENRFNWVKADPTFEGLRKTLVEPEDRVYIGEYPEQLQIIDDRPSKFVDSISIKKKTGSNLSEHWFDCDLPINPGLVAIIGNKGNGKSALGETIGLLGQTANVSAFSFLSTKRFRQTKDNKASHFKGSLTWTSGNKETAELHQDPDSNTYELVKYIPQNYLETLCNELESVEKTEFDDELRSVIFSHVREEERLGKSSLEDLIEYQTAQATGKIELIQKELRKVTDKIVTLESRGSVEHRTNLEGALAAKQHELDGHGKNKPEKVLEPETTEQQKKKINELNKRLRDKKSELSSVDEEIIATRNEIFNVNLLLSVARRLLLQIENFEREVNTFRSEAAADIEALGLKETDILTLKISKKPINMKHSALLEEKKRLERDLDSDKEGSKSAAKKKFSEELKAIQGQLDAPHKAYEAYLERKSAWEKKKKEIIGEKDTPKSINYYKEQVSRLELIPKELATERDKAVEKAGEIFFEKANLADTYRKLYEPVQDFIDSGSVAKEELQLQFNVEVSDTGFESTFFSYVSQGVRGTYCGTEEGRKRMRKLLSDSDLSTKNGVTNFIKKLVTSLLIDERDGKTKTKMDDLVKKGRTAQSLYNFIYGLDYLQPRYSIGISGKSLHELSPGERGALLLVFYLLVDQNNVPLIIDQPEENLDNQTVFKLLVPCIKEAKKQRQIIMITHNPNLAVVCDAEQIIHCSIDKHDDNRLSYKSGAIENPEINKAIVDILEGTRPAFDNRESKYFEGTNR